MILTDRTKQVIAIITLVVFLSFTILSMCIPFLTASFGQSQATSGISETNKPDVIIIQSEAFMDIRKVSELSLSQNPLQNYDKIKAKGQWGQLFVPVNGGQTCNSEFELLTGIRQPSVSLMPYTETIDKQSLRVNSLADQLSALGYSTSAVHPYIKEYFNRYKVYPLLGITNFFSIDSFKNPKKYGYWISDKSSFDKVKEVLENKALGDKPRFIFNVTVQNHGPFSYKSSNDLITVKADGISKEDKVSMQNYATGLKYTDQALADFIKYIDSRKKETIVVFYGDHQPTKEHKFFSNTKFFTAENGYYTTDYFIYNNKAKVDKVNKDIPLTSLKTYLLSSSLYNDVDKYNVDKTKADYFNYDGNAYKSLFLKLAPDFK